MSPNPQKLDRDLSVDSVEDFKRIDCRRYLRCLDVAAGSGWQQFHCNSCTDYDPETKVEREAAFVLMSRMLRKWANGRA